MIKLLEVKIIRIFFSLNITGGLGKETSAIIVKLKKNFYPVISLLLYLGTISTWGLFVTHYFHFKENIFNVSTVSSQISSLNVISSNYSIIKNTRRLSFWTRGNLGYIFFPILYSIHHFSLLGPKLMACILMYWMLMT